MTNPQEEVLQYGFVSSPVKVGDTVRRQTGSWTPTVHALLEHLHKNGFTRCPTVEGFDEQGREILSFIPGDAAVRPWPSILTQGDGIEQAGCLLREYHDTVEGFSPGGSVEWRIGKARLAPGQIIRHGDLGPWNTIWQNDTLAALIDWDFIQPGERIDDLAQMAYYFVPLRSEKGWKDAGFTERPDFAVRLLRLTKSYGMYSPKEVIEALLKLLQTDREIVQRFGGEGTEPWVSFLRRGDIEESIMDAQWIVGTKPDILNK
ncbi:MAG TPA: aminoglycoside phosphotransferase family protein [Candidatus Saccharimonadales bacterium]